MKKCEKFAGNISLICSRNYYWYCAIFFNIVHNKLLWQAYFYYSFINELFTVYSYCNFGFCIL